MGKDEMLAGLPQCKPSCVLTGGGLLDRQAESGGPRNFKDSALVPTVAKRYDPLDGHSRMPQVDRRWA
ncbi:MAG: hypothetical protein ABFC63_11470 [Thermoguttaceae bacterium]